MADGLTEEYIEEQIQKSRYPKEVRRAIRRFYEELNEPAAFVMTIGRPQEEKQDIFTDKLLVKLKEKGIDAVKETDMQASDPRVFVVTKESVHAPFLSPKQALEANIAVIDAVQELGGYTGYCNPHIRESFVEAKHTDEHEDFSDLSQLHPEKAREALKNFYHEFSSESKDSLKNLQELLKAVGAETKEQLAQDFKKQTADFGGPNACNFEQLTSISANIMKSHETEILADSRTFRLYQKHMQHEAWEKGISPDIIGKDNVEAVAQGKPPIHVFHGGKQGTKAYATLAAHDAADFIFGAVGVSMSDFGSNGGAMNYAFGNSSHGKREYTAENSYKYGFVYQYESRQDKQELLLIESGNKTFDGGNFDASKCRGHGDETVILPHQNKLEKIYLAVEEVNPQTGFLERRLFELESDDNGQIKDKKWRDFAELHDPINDNLKGYMVDRRNNMIKQYDELGREAVMSRKLSIRTVEAETKPTLLSNEDHLATLSGRPLPSSKPITEEKNSAIGKKREEAGIKSFFKKVMDLIPEKIKKKFTKPKIMSAEEKAKNRKAYKVIQTLRGIFKPKKTKKISGQVRVLTNEETATIQSPQQRDGR